MMMRMKKKGPDDGNNALIQSLFSDDEKYKHLSTTNKNIRQLHFGRQSVIELAVLLDKCPSLINMDVKCYWGVDLNAFNKLAQSIINHTNLNKFTINNLQRRNMIFDGITNILRLKKYSFINSLSIVFNRHYLDALRREKYTIPESFYQSLNNSSNNTPTTNTVNMEYDEIEKQLRPNCDMDKVLLFADSIFESQLNLLRYDEELRLCLSCKLIENMSFPKDIIDIIVDYMIYNIMDEEENVLMIMLKSLPNDMKSKLRQYFVSNYKKQEIKWKDKIHRTIQLNSWFGTDDENKNDIDSQHYEPMTNDMHQFLQDEDEDEEDESELNRRCHDEDGSSFSEID